jgi:hypothetical protein
MTAHNAYNNDKPGRVVSERGVRRQLGFMAQNPEFGLYVWGLLIFLDDWQYKTNAEKQRLCVQVRQIIARSRSMAVTIFGLRGVVYFEKIDIERIVWNKEDDGSG